MIAVKLCDEWLRGADFAIRRGCDRGMGTGNVKRALLHPRKVEGSELAQLREVVERIVGTTDRTEIPVAIAVEDGIDEGGSRSKVAYAKSDVSYGMPRYCAMLAPAGSF